MGEQAHAPLPWPLRCEYLHGMDPCHCLVGRLKQADVEPLIRLYTEPKCRQYLGGLVAEAEARQRIQRLVDAPASSPAWAIRLAPSKRPVGLVVLHPHHEGRDTELSYQLLPEYWGRGIATQAVRLVLEQAFGTMGLSRLVAETQTANHPSIRLLERVGMALDCRCTRFGAEQSIYAIDAR